MKKELAEITKQTPTEKSFEGENKIIQEILDSLIEQSSLEDKTTSLVKISYGSKDMTLKLRSGMAISGGLLATTYIENTRLTDKKEKETTFLYLAAKDILQKFATDKRTRVYYIFDTENPQMLKWAKTKGQDIFSWDRKEIESEDEGRGIFTKIFQPDKE